MTRHSVRVSPAVGSTEGITINIRVDLEPARLDVERRALLGHGLADIGKAILQGTEQERFLAELREAWKNALPKLGGVQ